MNFSGISEKTKLGQLLRFPLRYIPRNAQVPVLQGPLKGYKWIVGSSNHGCWLGSFEYSKQRIISSMVHSGTIALDIGAHVGFYTLLFARLVGSEGKVFAFEPLPRNAEFLRKHISINRISNANVLQVAVSDSPGSALFAHGPNSFTGQIAEYGDFEVEQVSIDNLIEQGKLPSPNYMKIDIEGAEYKALLGAEATLRDFHPAVFLATHSAEIHSYCCEFLVSLGYELRAINGQEVARTDEIVAL